MRHHCVHNCHSTDTARAYARGQLDPKLARRVRAHAAVCDGLADEIAAYEELNQRDGIGYRPLTFHLEDTAQVAV